MMHPHQPKWRVDRSRRRVETSEATPVTWICGALFAFILIYAFLAPIFRHLLERGL